MVEGLLQIQPVAGGLMPVSQCATQISIYNSCCSIQEIELGMQDEQTLIECRHDVCEHRVGAD